MKKKRYTWFANLIIILLLLSCFWIAQGASSPSPAFSKEVAFYANQNGDNLETVVLSQIQQAKKSILLIIYSLSSHEVIKALRDKSEQGVKVSIICDVDAPKNLEKRIPNASIKRRINEGIMHQKILVTDASQVTIGSANMTRESLRLHGNLILSVEHPVLAEAIAAKAEKLCQNTPIFQKMQQFWLHHQPAELWFLPDNPEATKRIIELIKTAKKTIRVAMFTWTRLDFAKAIAEAKDRGVDVQIVIDYHSGKGASQKIVEFLNQHRVFVKLSNGKGLLHHKFLYIDESILVNGSANWTKAAFTKNDDCFMILHQLTPPQIEQLNYLWKNILFQTSREDN